MAKDKDRRRSSPPDEEETPPEVGDSAVSTASVPPVEADDDETDDDADDDSDDSDEEENEEIDPHPDGITTADVEATIGQPIQQLKGGGDPALVNPEETAVARVEGRTSDASLRNADGPQIDEVPADINAGPKPSDAGPEAYPFPQGGDVDVATVPNDVLDGETIGPITVEDQAILLEHDLVPDRLVGRRGLITAVVQPEGGVTEENKDEVTVTVLLRDETGAKLVLPLSAVRIVKGALNTTVRG